MAAGTCATIFLKFSRCSSCAWRSCSDFSWAVTNKAWFTDERVASRSFSSVTSWLMPTTPSMRPVLEKYGNLVLRAQVTRPFFHVSLTRRE